MLVKTTSRRIGSDEENSSSALEGGNTSATTSPGFTRSYTYESTEDSGPKRRFEPQGLGFRYDGPTSIGAQQPNSPTGKSKSYYFETSVSSCCLIIGSSSSGKKNVGVAFSYVAGEEGKLADASRVLKNTSPRHGSAPRSLEKEEKEVKSMNIDYVESAYLKDKDTNATSATS